MMNVNWFTHFPIVVNNIKHKTSIGRCVVDEHPHNRMRPINIWEIVIGRRGWMRIPILWVKLLRLRGGFLKGLVFIVVKLGSKCR